MADVIGNLTRIADSCTRKDGSDCPLGEQCREAATEITALRARLSEFEAGPAGGGVVVKALVWSDVSPPVQGLCSYTHTRAETPFGFYSIEWKGWKDYDPRTVFFHADGSNVIANEDDLDAAKAAAQADYEARIRAALALDWNVPNA